MPLRLRRIAGPEAYREWAPHPALAARVVCAWRDPPRRRDRRVLPDACIDLVWDGQTLGVAGPDTRAVPIDDQREYVGVRFRPGAAPGFLGAGSDALLDAHVSLFDLWGAAARDLAGRISEQPDRAVTLLEHALLERLPAAAEPDPLVDALLQELAGAPLRDDALVVEDAFFGEGDEALGQRLAASLGVSQRTLRRRCTAAIGYGPKTLERVLRFRRALRLLRNRQPLAEAARAAGYADQSHLTNESQRLSGLTPAALATTPLPLSANGCD